MTKFILSIFFCSFLVNLSLAQNTPKTLDITIQGNFNIPVSDSMKKVMNLFPGMNVEGQINLNKNFSLLAGLDIGFITFKQDFVNTLIGTGTKEMTGSKQYVIYLGPKYIFHVSKQNDFRAFVSLAGGIYSSSLGDYTVTNVIQNQKVSSTYVTSSTSQTGISLGAGLDYDISDNVLFIFGVKFHKVFGRDNVAVTSTINGIGYAYTANLEPYSYLSLDLGLGYRFGF